MSPTRTPHDRLFQFLFGHVRHALACVRTALPAAVRDALDWTTFAVAGEDAVGPALALHRADAVFALRTAGGGHDVLVLVEHKAWADDAAGDQLLRYAVHLRRRAQRRGLAPPLVVALLVQHGADGAPRPRPSAPAPGPLADGQPQLPFHVDDLDAATEAQLRARDLTPLATLALLCLALPAPADRAATLAALERWSDLIRAVDADGGPPPAEDALAAICWYLADTTELTKEEVDMTVARKVVLDIAYPGTGGDKLRKQWFAEGKLEGLAEGRDEGRSQGLSRGLADGLQHALRTLLTRRFGPLSADADARLQAASPAQLQRWCERVLDAANLGEALAD